jgi:hypothetical protein
MDETWKENLNSRQQLNTTTFQQIKIVLVTIFRIA